MKNPKHKTRLGIIVRALKLAGLVSAVLFASSWPTRGDTGIEVWVQRHQSPNSVQTVATAMALDANDNMVVAGSSWSLSTFSWVYVTLKYSSTGLPLWTNRYQQGAANCLASAVAVDGAGSVIVTGDYSMNGFVPVALATIKYSSAGLPLWTNVFSRNAFASAGAVGTDTNGNVFVTGSTATNAGPVEFTTIKYSSAGLPLWTNFYTRDSYYWSYARALAVDPSGHVTIAGRAFSSGANVSFWTVLKYSNAGVPLWTNSNGYGTALSLAVDAGANVVATGESINGTNSAYQTIKYSPAGVALWTKSYSGWPQNSHDRAKAVALDSSGNVFVTGQSAAAGITPLNSDFATIKYSTAGVPLWTNRYDGNSNEIAYAVAVDRKGSVFVSGYSWSSATNYDYVTIKYSNGGLPLWTNRLVGGAAYSGFQNWRTPLAIGADGSAYASGTVSLGNGPEIVTVKYVSGPELRPLVSAGTGSWIGEGNTNLTVSWTAVPDQIYQLQCNTNWGAGDWQVVTSIVATGTVASVVVSTPPLGSQGFYRVLAP